MAKMNLKKAKFYCESCGSEVPQNAKFCGTCGKFFTFVRCPNCLFTGESKIFTNGCPKCGYAVKPDNFGGGNSSGTNTKRFSFSDLFTSNNVNNRYSKKDDSSLPVWIYIAVIAALIAVVLGFYSCIKADYYPL